MSVDLHPDIVRAIRQFEDTPLGRKYDRFTRRKYHLPGWKVEGKTIAGEFGGRSTRSGRGVVSSAGARGPAQFIPGTRQDFIRQYGIDPWKNDASAVKALAIHQMTRGGIAGYNPGMPTYQNYILGQKLNASDRRALRSGNSGGSAGSGTGSFTLAGRQSTDVGLQSHTIPGQSFAADRQAAAEGLFLGGKLTMNRLLSYKQEVNGLQDVPSRKVSDLVVQRNRSKPLHVRTSAGASAAPRGSGHLFEVFYDPMGRYWDSGSVHTGAIGGHADHVHVAGNKSLLRALGHEAQRMGLAVGENSMFGGKTPTSGHATNSFHYRDEAIDVSGGTAALRAKFARIALQEARRRARKTR